MSSRGLVCLLVLAAAAVAQGTKKQYKSQAEFQIYDAAAKDLSTNNFTKALADLDSWKKDFPESDYRDDRQSLYIQAYAGAKQPSQALAAAGELLNKDLDAALGNPAAVIKVLFTVENTIQQIPVPSASETDVAGKAARQLLAYSKKPEGVADDAWKQARAQLETSARGALLYIALTPGTQAMKQNDCPAAEKAFTQALEAFPQSGQAAWYLGTADLCLYKTQPEKATSAIYAFARAASVDPAQGMVDAQWQQNTVTPFLQKVYSQYHGNDPEGLRQLRELAAKGPAPPADFRILSVTEIAAQKQAEFEKSNPQLALWMKIKGALADNNGEQYFTQNLQATEVPKLRGVVVEARPACRPKELLVAVPLPDAQQPLQAEIALKLDKPLAGAPEKNAELQWAGEATSFMKSPFLLTMDVESGMIEGLNLARCGAAPARKRKK